MRIRSERCKLLFPSLEKGITILGKDFLPFLPLLPHSRLHLNHPRTMISPPASSSRVTRKENRNNTPLEHGRRKVPKFDPVTIYYALLFDISILNNSYGFRYGYRLKRITIVGIKSEKKEEINKRKRKKTNAIRILPFYRNAWCVRASLFKRDVVAVFQTLRFRLNGAK